MKNYLSIKKYGLEHLVLFSCFVFLTFAVMSCDSESNNNDNGGGNPTPTPTASPTPTPTAGPTPTLLLSNVYTLLRIMDVENEMKIMDCGVWVNHIKTDWIL